MIEKVWKLRSFVYLAVLAIFCGSYVSYKFKEFIFPQQEDKFKKTMHQINASFWPPDIIPHPHLPQPHYPPPGEPVSIFDLA